ncbi:EamA-like transporter family protein [Loktanella sp. PT4BL]|uniref:DMT family transporter n=1 Tax=Loktanella sp. PT4BL TaxID=2135611 RepID=UPI000D764882|nr:DMT family transporter [Loktanella sp. PT4BL]PXW70609.1 EamA-like transporter family protein [Loktanella sp. PT4BL]
MDNIRGAGFMVFAMLCFAVEDGMIKLLAADMPVGQIISIACFGGLIGFLVWSAIKGDALWQPDYLNRKVLLRSASDTAGSILFATSLALVPLTTASAVIQATPLVVTLGAALFLGQAVGWRRWVAIVIGFIGVLIIIRPGMEGFTPATLLAVAGMLGLAARDLITRSLTVTLNGPQLATHTFALIVPAGLLVTVLRGQSFVMPDAYQSLILFGTIVVGMIAYLAILAATRGGNAGIISSFRYSRMIFALMVGYLMFREVPDMPTVIGAAIIMATGIYTLWREARLHRASLQPGPAL